MSILKSTTRIVDHNGIVYVPPRTTAIISSFDGDHENKNPGLMEKYLEPLNGRRFKERKDAIGNQINMNIVVVNLPESDRKKILEFDGDEYDMSEDEYCPKLNGVVIESSDLTKGYPTGYDNYQFMGWKLDQR